ncbi:MAG: nitrite reductase (NAD(P)H) small subunit [Ignavibacteria bacterium]|nr:MAG: nitrite reductase (NAD(P)H) small subunit [Ignavibacteria bacterium]
MERKKKLYDNNLNRIENDNADEFVKVCKTDELKEATGKRFIIDDVEIALFKVDGNVYAISNICPHQKTAMMHEGFIEKGKVVCPLHGWEFNLTDGTMDGGRRGIDCYKTEVRGDDVFVKVYKKELNW